MNMRAKSCNERVSVVDKSTKHSNTFLCMNLRTSLTCFFFFSLFCSLYASSNSCGNMHVAHALCCALVFMFVLLIDRVTFCSLCNTRARGGDESIADQKNMQSLHNLQHTMNGFREFDLMLIPASMTCLFFMRNLSLALLARSERKNTNTHTQDKEERGGKHLKWSKSSLVYAIFVLLDFRFFFFVPFHHLLAFILCCALAFVWIECAKTQPGMWMYVTYMCWRSDYVVVWNARALTFLICCCFHQIFRCDTHIWHAVYFRFVFFFFSIFLHCKFLEKRLIQWNLEWVLVVHQKPMIQKNEIANCIYFYFFPFQIKIMSNS